MTEPTTNHRTPSSQPGAAATRIEPTRDAGPTEPVPVETERHGSGWLLIMLAPLLCCGGPLVIAGIVAAGAATRTLAIAVPALLLALALVIWSVRRRRGRDASCCPPPRSGQPR